MLYQTAAGYGSTEHYQGKSQEGECCESHPDCLSRLYGLLAVPSDQGGVCGHPVPVEGGGGSTEVPETTVGCGGGGREVQGSEEGEGGEEGAGEGKVGCWGD